MIVHFAASSRDVVGSIDNYRAIVNAIHGQGAMLAADWIEPAYMHLRAKDFPTVENWAATYEQHMQAIARSDILIADVTKPSFGVGFQVSAAIHQKKPVLMLMSEKTDWGAFNIGVNNSLIQRHTYAKESVEGIIAKFIKHNTIDTKDLRFNFFIDREIYNYLRWTALRTGKTKAEILRDLVAREINNKES